MLTRFWRFAKLLSMGLDTTHDCWHGAYSAFNRWRQRLCEVAGIPPLPLMDGFWAKGGLYDPIRHDAVAVDHIYATLPIKWEALKPSPLHILLSHSDCAGSIAAADCGLIADALEALLPLLDGDGGGHVGLYRNKTQAFIIGLRKAHAAGENVEFH